MRDACRAPVGAFNNLWIPGYLVFRTPPSGGLSVKCIYVETASQPFCSCRWLGQQGPHLFHSSFILNRILDMLANQNTAQMLAKFSAPWLKGRFLFLSWNNWNLSKWCEQRKKVRWSVKRLNALQKGINGNETKVPWHEGSEWLTITSRTQF